MTTERKSRRSSALLGALGITALVVGCAGGPPRLASDLEAEVPANLRADYVSFTQNCSKCHSLDRPLQAHVDDVRHWDIYVAKMMRTAGSAISAVESPKILRFLYWYTQRKERLKAEDKAKKMAPVEEAKPAEPKAAPAEPSSGASVAPAATTAPETAVQPTTEPAQGNQGEAAP
jgi:hypothetical protein